MPVAMGELVVVGRGQVAQVAEGGLSSAVANLGVGVALAVAKRCMNIGLCLLRLYLY